jgi:membrane fusion protein
LNKLIVIAVAILGVLGTMLWGLELPRLVRSSGYVDSTVIPIKIYSPIAATVTKVHWKNGQTVSAFAPLIFATTERPQGGSFVEVQQRAMLHSRLQQLRYESVRAKESSDTLSAALVQRVEAVKREIGMLQQETQLQKTRHDLSDVQLLRYKQLNEQGFVSLEAVNTRQGESMDMSARTLALQRTQSTLARELEAIQSEITLARQKTDTQLSQYKREMLTLEQELNESQSKRIEIISSASGIVTQLEVQPGQHIKPDIPVAVIIPNGAKPQVTLLLPSRSVGFIKLGQDVSVRYPAYPHEHYGRHVGKVIEISQVALLPSEIPNQMQTNGEPLFTIKVSLPDKYLQKNGVSFHLSPGMLAEADIQLDRLKIYQWLLQPLYRLEGRL